jgi:hypothetical protein
MEVHHHPNVEKKNLKEYFLEFLMIFLAVTLGFVAENMREHLSDSAKEKEYANSLVNNLKDDTLRMHNVIEENEYKLDKLTKFMSLSHRSLSDTVISKQFYNLAISSVGYYSLFQSNDATMLQLKNSGGLRFMRKGHVADSIAMYDTEISSLYAAGTLYTNATNLAILATHDVMDYSIFFDSSYYQNKTFTGKPLPFLTYDPLVIKKLFNKIDFEIGATRNYLNNLHDRLPIAERLIAYLQRTYSL